MTSYVAEQVLLPPDIPPYLEHLYKLNPVVGVPSDDELIGIHSIIRATQKMAEIPGMGDPVLLSLLSEHLFDAQMAKYRSKYLGITFPENTVYNPPVLPVHVPIQLEPITGAPSEEQVIKVQDTIRLYHQFSNVPSMFDPRVNMELLEHLFDIQMGKPVQKYLLIPSPDLSSLLVISTTTLAKTVERAANLVGEPGIEDAGIRDAIERSNRLAEQANQLIERSNQITERSNQLVEQSSQSVDQSNRFEERFNQLFERLNQHLEQSNELAKQSTRPVEKLGDVLGNINKVLVRIQHAIVRNHKGNTIRALDCLVNEKGETPAMSHTTLGRSFANFPSTSMQRLSVVINGVTQNAGITDGWLGEFLCFYGIGDELREGVSSVELKKGKGHEARAMLQKYLNSCLG
ncbi:unnamed protein product [Rhizoctonia solani]|uniref:Laminin domain protein n=1 Tax=Rhizoctonia solani TaxID=456999 RepID=A0A8H2XCC7_9AGAM|nr:unnamed protein product [Rhizoctonia solani]